jgi:hypothetical protein
MTEYRIDQADSNISVKIIDDETYIGQAVLSTSEKTLKLNWIEIEEEFQYSGNGTDLMNHLVDLFLDLHCDTFTVSVVDEQTLPFYIKWLTGRGLDLEKINDCISEDGEHPIINIARLDLEQKQEKKAKI